MTRQQRGNGRGNTSNNEVTPPYRGKVLPHHGGPTRQQNQVTPASDQAAPSGPAAGLRAGKASSSDYGDRIRRALLRSLER
jgi:hypothetical protein